MLRYFKYLFFEELNYFQIKVEGYSKNPSSTAIMKITAVIFLMTEINPNAFWNYF